MLAKLISTSIYGLMNLKLEPKSCQKNPILNFLIIKENQIILRACQWKKLIEFSVFFILA
jgi:hypothetical protein